MKHKLFILFVVIISAAQLQAQSLTITNLTVTDAKSKFIYIGMENKFLVEGFAGKIDLPAEQTPYRMHGDTLLLYPSKTGRLIVSFTNNNIAQQVAFNAIRLAPLEMSIGVGHGYKIAKETISDTTSIKIQQADGFLNNYDIDSLVATINSQVFYLNSNLLPASLLSAITNATVGDVLVINYVHAFNNSTKNSLSVESPTSFRIE